MPSDIFKAHPLDYLGHCRGRCYHWITCACRASGQRLAINYDLYGWTAALQLWLRLMLLYHRTLFFSGLIIIYLSTPILGTNGTSARVRVALANVAMFLPELFNDRENMGPMMIRDISKAHAQRCRTGSYLACFICCWGPGGELATAQRYAYLCLLARLLSVVQGIAGLAAAKGLQVSESFGKLDNLIRSEVHLVHIKICL